jgi:hypothetical protein
VRPVDPDAAAFVLYISAGSLSLFRSYEQIMPVFQSIIFDGLARHAGRNTRNARARHVRRGPRGERR